MRKYLQVHMLSLLLFIFTMLTTIVLSPTLAQTSDLILTETAEYDIGFGCPLTSVLDASGTILWVLMDECYRGRFSLHAYDLTTGEQINEDDYADELSILTDAVYIDIFSRPLGLTPSGDLSLRYSDNETAASTNIIIPITSGGEVTTSTEPSYDDLLAEYSEYPDYSIYSPDHTKVIAVGATSFYVIDIQTETEIAEIPVEDTTDSATAAFSENGEHLYIIHYNSEDTIDSTLFIYDIVTASLLGEYQVPSSAIWVSPDEKYVAANLYSFNIGDVNELIILDLETGLISPAVNLNEEPAPVTKCLNNGNDMSDVDFRTTGRFSFSEVNWSPDNSSISIALSYGSAMTSTGCIYDYSRLRTYTIEKSS